ncbi:NUDIX domain-containing protein [Candidatus Parcubacteria bacterium]|nr:NUDIX domain-containing protein [Candidatus Parcubacteria bacterium]
MVWLARKKRKVGAGLWNGWGGKRIKRDRTILDTAIREFKAETQGAVLRRDQLKRVAVINFFEAGERIFKCHVFFGYKDNHGMWNGELAETDEMGPGTWFSWAFLPFEEMMPADREWMTPLFRGQRIKGDVYYTKGKASLERPFEYQIVPDDKPL